MRAWKGPGDRVHQFAAVLFTGVVGAVVDEDLDGDTDLRGGQADAFGHRHAREHVLDERGQFVVKGSDFGADGFQHRIADDADRPGSTDDFGHGE
jgi:hypothetical protein